MEYLAGLARALDPIPIMEVSELVAELRRRALPLPDRGPWDTDPVYAGMCAEVQPDDLTTLSNICVTRHPSRNTSS